MRTIAIALLIAAFTITGCATPPKPDRGAIVEQFDMPETPGVRWTKWSDGSYTNTAGHDGRIDPRIPLCDYRTITADDKRLKSGKPYAAECRIK